jgi:putative ABC transport system ATP-binding protein
MWLREGAESLTGEKDMASFIEALDLTKIYNPGESEVRALDHVTLRIDHGEYVAIIGQSGSGKSTLLNLLGCLDVPTSGRLMINGCDVGRLNDNELSRIRSREIGFVFQGFNLIPALTARKNVELPLVYRRVRRGTRERLAEAALTLVGLEQRMDHLPSQLSGGQQQRVAIARALVVRPPVILADEPTGNLDSSSSREIMNIFGKIHQAGKTVILITHDQKVAENADRIIRIADGRVIEDRERGL